MKSKRTCRHRQRGAVLIIAMVFVLLFATLAVSLCTMANSNAQIAHNQRKVNSTLYAAQSGLECARLLVSTVVLEPTPSNIVTDGQADTAWLTFRDYIDTSNLAGQSLSINTNEEVVTQSINFGSDSTTFQIRFYRPTPKTIRVESTGTSGQISRKISMDMEITKDNSVMEYAIASRGRMWVTGDSIIGGDIYSSWDRPEISPFDITADSRIEGTINTVLTQEEIESDHPYPYDDYQFEDPNDPDCVIRGYNEGINYGVHDQSTMPGMEISDYDTDGYNSELYSLPSSSTIIREYFPHAPSDQGGYTTPRDYGSVALNRNVYDGMTLNDVRVPDNRNALFRNCTFEGVLYVDCYKSGSSYYNNIRFEDCTFNGIIVTDVPQVLNWQRNCLYFTGGATFNNESAYQEATILAPHFNVNLGNTNPEQSDNNVLTGAIVGGIVDIRGNAQINGTVISMCDTTIYSSGYVTNIGATLGDGGSETTELGDVGTIEITPDPAQLLPSGITSPIIIKPDTKTYSEGV